MATKNRTYAVTFKVVVETPVDIGAQSFEEAIQKARTYEVKDIVDFNTDFIDGDISITSVWCDTDPVK